MKKTTVLFLGLSAMAALAAVPASGAAIFDASYFDGVLHTLITFETDGNGDPVYLAHTAIFLDEYFDQGFTFMDTTWFYRDSTADAQGAQAIGGSPENYMRIPYPFDMLTIDFNVPVTAFGLWIQANNRYDTGIVFRAYASSGVPELIDTVYFEDDAIDGTIGEVDYGFLGISSDREISYVTINCRENAFLMDNLMFDYAVPEPSIPMLLSAGGLLSLLSLRRRRRP